MTLLITKEKSLANNCILWTMNMRLHSLRQTKYYISKGMTWLIILSITVMVFNTNLLSQTLKVSISHKITILQLTSHFQMETQELIWFYLWKIYCWNEAKIHDECWPIFDGKKSPQNFFGIWITVCSFFFKLTYPKSQLNKYSAHTQIVLY